MNEEILCHKCNHLINIDDWIDDYGECGEDNTINVIECPDCKAKNSIYFQVSVDFYGREADEKDLKDWDVIK